ncbi:MAG: TIGR04255 family protein [Phycisphaerae bacterium]|nr:TIGR04255 family protein [Phycisphaerae bacterium]
MSKRPPDLADFRKPPVIEVVLGIQFRTKEPVNALHLGSYWQSIQGSFPKYRVVPPLPGFAEDLSKPPFLAEPSIEFGTGVPPLPRYWFLDESETKLIQLQTNWFLHNWRKVTGAEEYPRFEAISTEFFDRWRQFADFCATHNLGKPQAELAEVTYVNHIMKGSCWAEMADLSNVFSFLSEIKDSLLQKSLEAVSYDMCFRIPEDKGRLRVSILPAIRARDRDLGLRMNLTVRGPIKDQTEDAFAEWFGVARWWIVKAFELLTTKKAHDHWERISP